MLHSVAAFDFASSSGCVQMVDGPTHIASGTLNLVLTDIPDLATIVVSSPVDTSDTSALLLQLSLDQSALHAVVNITM